MVKKFEFEGETLIMATAIFVRFSLFLTSTYSENLIYHSFNDLKVQNFGGPD